MLQVREDLDETSKPLLNAQLVHWLSASLEVAEIAQKVLDWKSSNLRSRQFGILVCKEYLLLVEEISI